MTEMAQAFSTFANQGIPRKLQSILKIQDKFGKEIYKFSDSNYVEDLKNLSRFLHRLQSPEKELLPLRLPISSPISFLIITQGRHHLAVPPIWMCRVMPYQSRQEQLITKRITGQSDILLIFLCPFG